MREPFPLQMLIREIEHLRDNCYVCDRAPLEDLLCDLRRWSLALASPEGGREVLDFLEPEAATVTERARLHKARTG